MSIEFIQGNLFKYPGLQGWAHGVNCQGVMGAGIAVEFKRRFPEMFRIYRNMCQEKILTPGLCFSWTQDTPVVFNLATQDKWEARLDWVDDSVQRMMVQAKNLGVTTIGLPAIGAGLGGLDWQDVKSVLERIGNSTSKTHLVCFETFVP